MDRLQYTHCFRKRNKDNLGFAGETALEVRCVQLNLESSWGHCWGDLELEICVENGSPMEAIHSPLKLILNDIRAGKYKGLIPRQTWAFLKVLVYLEKRLDAI